jgi:hypothetical protein
MLLNPIQDSGIGFFRRLPEKTVRLALQDLHHRAGNTIRKYP